MDILHFDDELVILQRSATELVIYCRLAGIVVTISWPTHNGGLRAWLLARGLFIECFCGFTSHRTEPKPCRFVVSKVTGDVFGFCHYAQARCLFKINFTEVHDTCLLTSEYPDLPTLNMDILLVAFTLHGYPHQDLAPHFEGYAGEHNSGYPAGTHQLSGPLLTRRPSNAHGNLASQAVKLSLPPRRLVQTAPARVPTRSANANAEAGPSRILMDSASGHQGFQMEAPVTPSSSAGASFMTCIATIHTAHCPRRPSAAAGHDAPRDYKATARLLDAPRAYNLTPDAPALSFLDARVALISDDPLRLQLDMRHHSRAWGPLHPFPIACTVSLAARPPAITISGTAPLSSPPDACASRAAPLAGATHPLRVQRLPLFHIVPVTLIAASHTTTVFGQIPPSPLGACASVHPQPGVCTPTVFSHRRRLSYPCRRDDPLRHPKLDTTHLHALRYYPHRRRLRNAQLRDLRKGSAAVFSARSPRTRSGKIPRSGRLQPLRARVRA
ncbi:hypothetical protein B0H14DRAFT_3867071 [Mycena olivaceomarginata]|nr:hypothetical protein B0H14DRAFT_3867071 [Mycena olivaceomarginata]